MQTVRKSRGPEIVWGDGEQDYTLSEGNGKILPVEGTRV